MYLILRPLRDLVKMSISWSFELTKLVSTSICLVLSWKTGLDAICNAAWLTSFICSYFPNLNSWRSCLNHMSSHIAKAIAWYSDSALDLTTTSCFLLFQDIKLPPIRMLIWGWTSPVCICVTNNLGMTSVFIQHTLAWCSFNISKNVDHNIPMVVTWWL